MRARIEEAISMIQKLKALRILKKDFKSTRFVSNFSVLVNNDRMFGLIIFGLRQYLTIY